jgi:hypothetical protein
MKELSIHLKKKGWSKKEIQKVLKILERAKANKHPRIKVLDKALYWILLAVAIIKNLIIAIALIPFLLILRGIALYFIVFLIGISFGFLFEILVRRLEDLETKHHIFLGILIPLSSILSFILVISFTNALIVSFGVEIFNKPMMVASVYSIAFLLPYIVYNLLLKKIVKN